MRLFLSLLLVMSCAMAWADPLPRKAKIGVAIVEPRFAAKQAVFDLLLQGFFPVDIEYSEWKNPQINPSDALTKRLCPALTAKFEDIECVMLDTPPAPESKRPRLDYLREPFTPAETREQAFQAARKQSLDGLILVSAGASAQPSPGGYFSVVIRNRFPVEQEIPAGVVVSIRMDLYRVKDGQRLAFVKSHGQPHRLRITAPGARSAMEILEGSGGSQIEKRIEELWGPSINGMLGGIDMTLYSRFKEKNPWAYFVEE